MSKKWDTDLVNQINNLKPKEKVGRYRKTAAGVLQWNCAPGAGWVDVPKEELDKRLVGKKS